MTSFLSSPIFETFISLVLIFAVVSLLVSAFTEFVNSYFKERGKQLKATIVKLFDNGDDVNFGNELYSHPMVKNICKDEKSLPQYISDSMFSQVIMEVIGNHARTGTADASVNLDDPFVRIKVGLDKLKDSSLKTMLKNMVEKSQAMSSPASGMPLTLLDRQMKHWYNDQMDRMTGWYKDSIKKRMRIIAFMVAIGLNIDGIHVFQTIYRNPELRTELTKTAENVTEKYKKLNEDTTLSTLEKQLAATKRAIVKTDSGKKDTTQLSAAKNILVDLERIDILTNKIDSTRKAYLSVANDQIEELEEFSLPIGWDYDEPPMNWLICAKRKIAGKDSVCNYNCNGKPEILNNPRLSDYFLLHRRCNIWNVLSYIVGIILTALAASLGAPFWFEMLLKFVNVRKAGTKPVNSDKEH